MAEDNPGPRPLPTRPAREGEICSCGRPAVEVFFTEDLGPVPACDTNDEPHRPVDCPPWCAEVHYAPYDSEHLSDSRQVPLDAHPWQEYANGAWRSFLKPMLVGLAKAPGRPACIEIIGTDDQLAGRLTAYEADQLAEILRDLAGTLRDESQRACRADGRR